MRPSEYTQELADRVCELIMDGKSLRKIEAMEFTPSRLTILKWLRENPSFQTQYAHAREEQAEALAEEILDISDEVQLEYVLGDDGQQIPMKLDATAVARNRLRVDSRKWIASKLKPKKYGDSTQIKHADADGNKLSFGGILEALDGRTTGLPSADEAPE